MVSPQSVQGRLQLLDAFSSHCSFYASLSVPGVHLQVLHSSAGCKRTKEEGGKKRKTVGMETHSKHATKLVLGLH